ncbi:MAG TPA: hypothetical protein VEH31_00900, partial [Streptosporangiaceae bacterium]|nr:hypothetical protein [Streptosporangiaceae bacterium]
TTRELRDGLRPQVGNYVTVDRSYPRARALAAQRPGVPAAVATFDASGRAPSVVFDLDVSRGGPARVLADAERLAALLDGVGAAYVVDESPSGGLHVHVPLAEPAGFDEVARVMTAAKGLFASLDRAPMSNRKTGCIRPPGAAHRLGGSQRLVTGFAAARRVFLRRNRPSVWARLVDRLAPADPDPDPPPLPDHRSSPRRPRRPRRPLPARLELLARTGGFPAGRYRSGSEARQAVLTSAFQRGWGLDDVVAEVAAGRWPGLRGFYARPRYRGADWTVPLGRDWAAAERFLGSADPRSPKLIGRVTSCSIGADRNNTRRRSSPRRPRRPYPRLPARPADQWKPGCLADSGLVEAS